jgi:hypothetical protein
MTSNPLSVHAALTRHFLRRFLENDLIAPDADRTHTLAVAGATLFSTSLFVTVAMSVLKYIASNLTPGQAAVEALDDRFFYIATSMVVVALAAVVQWDALSLDARDAEILGALPVPRFAIHRAKLAAVAIFGVAAAAVVNLMPTIVFPMMLVAKHDVRVVSLLYLAVVHLIVTLGAAAFGYLVIIALRAGLSAALGPRRFPRVSPWVQSLLVIALGSALLLLPATASHVERTHFGRRAVLSPPMWFLGAYEMAAGSIVVDAPRGRLSLNEERADTAFTARYRRHNAQLRRLAPLAGGALPIVALLAAAAYVVNARRAFATGVRSKDRRSPWHAMQRAMEAMAQDDPTARAGFFFTLAAMWRSPAHRLTLTAGAAIGLAASVVTLWDADLGVRASGDPLSARLLMVQPLFVGTLLIGFRHAIRVPTELRANWIFQLAWRNLQHRYLAGVKRAAIVGAVFPGLAIVFPLYAFVLGPWLACAHALLGAAGGVVMVEALLLRYRRVPFVCSYMPDEKMKALAPLYVLLFVLGMSAFARTELAALESVAGTVALLGALVATCLGLRWAAARGTSAPIEFNEAPPTALRLHLGA